ncbi:hypothetical protein AZE42_13544 [Rhizopogon vesiculosus]|uniref:Uncharacterized protein n=1 Tax=Rhizopogon vesiculosus TaxID=180088 RepID=A0A1J8RFT8_9AGAM|nr:hypothetical protein AZE42_13544 [Rhizopogon vesiculosus]
MRGLPLHSCHEELKDARSLYADEITSTKKQHWIDWLEDLEGNDIWTANRYVTSEPSDGSRSRIPTLTVTHADGSITEASTNDEKSRLIAESFFPPPPAVDSVPQDQWLQSPRP